MVELGGKLRALRRAKGLTQKQLADQLGMTKSVISAYETDLRSPSYDVLIRIASIFGTTTDYLLGIEHDATVDVSGLSTEDKQLVVRFVNRLKVDL